EAQKEDSEIWTIVENLNKQVEFRFDDDNALWQDTRLVVPNDASLREALLTEAHKPPSAYGTYDVISPQWRAQQVATEEAKDDANFQPSLIRDQSSNPTSSTNTNPKGRNRKGSKQRVENSNLEEQFPPVVTMADQRTMAELLRTPTEGYAEAIVVPPILVEQFELKHNTMADQRTMAELLRTPTEGWKFVGKMYSRCVDDYRKQIKVNQQTSAMTTAMTAMLKQFQATPPPASVKAVEEICVTCGGAHPYYQCLAAGGNTFPELRVNIQGYVSTAVVNYNQGNPGYRPQAITSCSGLVFDGPTVPTPPQFINPKVDERVEETFTDPNLAEYTIKVLPPPV
nr:putative reverse transcriptase domain-containing protein [Tanacetum cinerariifolium]